MLTDFNPLRRRFLIRDIPGAVVSGYAVKAGIVVSAIEFFSQVQSKKYLVLKPFTIQVTMSSKRD